MLDFNFNYLGKFYLDRLKNITVKKATEKDLVKSIQQAVKYNKNTKYSAAYYKGIQDGMYGKTNRAKYDDETDPVVKLIYDTAYKFISKKFEKSL